MKILRTETETIEKYLADKLNTGETLLFKVRLQLDPVLRQKVLLQQKTYQLVNHFGRRQLKTRLEKTHRDLFRNPAKLAFQQQINNLFPNKH